jgi:hypothetical protein
MIWFRQRIPYGPAAPTLRVAVVEFTSASSPFSRSPRRCVQPESDSRGRTRAGAEGMPVQI